MSELNGKEITILQQYYTEIEKIIKQSEQFETVSDFVNFVLAEMLSNPDLDEGEEKKLQKRLQSLGYL